MYNNPLPFFMSKSYTTKREREKKPPVVNFKFLAFDGLFHSFHSGNCYWYRNQEYPKTRYVSQVIDKPYQIKSYRVHLVRIELISLMVM